MKCLWCKEELDNNNYYSLYGKAEYLGPICISCADEIDYDYQEQYR